MESKMSRLSRRVRHWLHLRPTPRLVSLNELVKMEGRELRETLQMRKEYIHPTIIESNDPPADPFYEGTQLGKDTAEIRDNYNLSDEEALAKLERILSWVRGFKGKLSFVQAREGLYDSISGLLVHIFTIRYDIGRGRKMIPTLFKLMALPQVENLVRLSESSASCLMQYMFSRRGRSFGPELLPFIIFLRQRGAEPYLMKHLLFVGCALSSEPISDAFQPAAAYWKRQIPEYGSAWSQLTTLNPLSCRSVSLIFQWLHWEISNRAEEVHLLRYENDIERARLAAERLPHHLPSQLYLALMEKVDAVAKEMASRFRLTWDRNPNEEDWQQVLARLWPNGRFADEITAEQSSSSTTNSTSSATPSATAETKSTDESTSSSSSSNTNPPVINHSELWSGVFNWLSLTISNLPPLMKSAELVDLVCPGFDLKKLVHILTSEGLQNNLLWLQLEATTCEVYPRSLLELLLTLPQPFLLQLAPVELQLIRQLQRDVPLNALPLQSFILVLERLVPTNRGDFGWLIYEQIIQWQSCGKTHTSEMQHQQKQQQLASPLRCGWLSHGNNLQLVRLFRLLGGQYATCEEGDKATAEALSMTGAASAVVGALDGGQHDLQPAASSSSSSSEVVSARPDLKSIGTMKRDIMVTDLLRRHCRINHANASEQVFGPIDIEVDFFTFLVCPILSSPARVKEYFECVGNSTDRLWPDRGTSSALGLLEECEKAMQLHLARGSSRRISEVAHSMHQLLVHEHHQWREIHRPFLYASLCEWIIPDLAGIALQYLIRDHGSQMKV